MKRRLRHSLFMLFCAAALNAQSLNVHGQISVWTSSRFEKPALPTAGIRYTPELSLERPAGAALIDGLVSCNTYSSHIHDGDSWQSDSRLKLYRGWIRYSNDQSEFRVGLQKINFGSAALIRPLMWFDRMDPRDPLQLTEGVWGILYRHYFLSNANLWFWALWRNEDPKGWEVLSTDRNTPEWGGRIQIPVPMGEVAVSGHQRRVDLDASISGIKQMLGVPEAFEIAFGPLGTLDERRLGLDGKWDITIGLWGETAWVHRDTPLIPTPWQRMTTVGADYTFGLGNGLHAMIEHARIEMAGTMLGSVAESADFTALSLNYPLGLMDTATALVYRDWENKNWYRFIRWQRSYDAIQLHAMAFWNPDALSALPQMASSAALAGKGFQLLFVLNH